MSYVKKIKAAVRMTLTAAFLFLYGVSLRKCTPPCLSLWERWIRLQGEDGEGDYPRISPNRQRFALSVTAAPCQLSQRESQGILTQRNTNPFGERDDVGIVPYNGGCINQVVYPNIPSSRRICLTVPSRMRSSRWARASPTANHFWFRGKSSQLLARMSQVMRPVMS